MDRTQVRLDRSAPPDPEAVPRLPTLSPGLTLLDTETRAVGPLDSLVLDHLLGRAGEVVWVDAGGHATTRNLARLAPSMALLERVRVARGFTAYQHHTLVVRACDSFPPMASLVVVPWVDALYRDGDCADPEAERLLASSVDRLATLADEREVPVLVTRRAADDPTGTLADRATTLRCRETRFGPRFVGDGFETLVYGEGRSPSGAETVQTTLAFWARVLERRSAIHADTPATGAV
jgi:hypothetical protein